MGSRAPTLSTIAGSPLTQVCPLLRPNLPEMEWGAGVVGEASLGRDISLFPAASYSTTLTSPPSPWPRASLSPAQSPGVADPLQQAYAGMHHYAGFTGRYVALGEGRRGSEGPKKGIEKFVGELGSLLKSRPSHSPTPGPRTTSLGVRITMDWTELVKDGQADGALLGRWLLGFSAHSQFCLQQPIRRLMPQ